jgi:hypothetical protein
MPKQPNDTEIKSVPKDLPMPKYEYQKASGGSFAYSFEEQKPASKIKKQLVDLCLQNLKLAAT